MSGTIDSIDANINNKIAELQKIITIYNNYDFNEYDNSVLEQLNTDISELNDDYHFGSVNLLKQYYNIHNEEDRTKYYKAFIAFNNTSNISTRLKRIYTACKRIRKIYEINDPEVATAFRQYDYTTLDIDYISKNLNNCSCGEPFSIESKTGESVCQKCGHTEKMYGVVFEDDQFFYQEGQRTKHGKYDPTKHCKFWVDRIQAKESTEIPEAVLNKIKFGIKRDNLWLEHVTCNHIRKYLKEIDRTDLNSHVSLLKKLITKIDPPQFTEQELKLIYMYFSRIMQIHNRTKLDDVSATSNSPYHPFFVYKIVEQILSKPIHRARCKEILSSIHLQSRDTLIKNDRIWQYVCEEIPEFKYIPTYR